MRRESRCERSSKRTPEERPKMGPTGKKEEKEEKNRCMKPQEEKLQSEVTKHFKEMLETKKEEICDLTETLT